MIGEYLKKIAELNYGSGDNYSSLSKKGKWHFGQSVDYPLQHGPTSDNVLSEDIVETILKERDWYAESLHKPQKGSDDYIQKKSLEILTLVASQEYKEKEFIHEQHKMIIKTLNH